MVVWKFKLVSQADSDQTIRMPSGATILRLKEHFGDIAIWALCDPNAAPVDRKFYVYMTGSNLPSDAGAYIGTAFYADGLYIIHVFEHP